MTDSNTPTPELVERLKSHDLDISPDWSDENDKRQWIDTADALLSEAAAAIAKLTAERDAWRLSAETLKSQIQMDRAEHEAVLKIAESLKKRVKELEAEWDHQ